MAVAAQRIERTKSLYEASKECLEFANGDRALAAAELRKMIDTDAGLRREMIEPLLDGACWDQIRRSAHETRRTYWTANAPKAKADNASGIQAVAEQHAKDWLDYPLSTGTRLGDATAEDLRGEIDMHEMHARTNAIRAAFYKKIVGALGKRKRVREALTRDQLDRFASEASHVA